MACRALPCRCRPRPRACRCRCGPTAKSVCRAGCRPCCTSGRSTCPANPPPTPPPAPPRPGPPAARAQTAKPPEIAISLDLGRDFALQGQGITTRLTGALNIHSSTEPGAAPRVTGELRTEQGRYPAWGQVLDIEAGLIRFNGPYDNPSLDILALRPNISVPAGVPITGSAPAPRRNPYPHPPLPTPHTPPPL